MNDYDNPDQIIERGLCERSLYEYVKHSWPIIEPKTKFLPNWHVGLITEYLTAVLDGEILRLIINIPPRYMKSILTSVTWPTWAWTKRPELRFLYTSYNAALSTKHNTDRRLIVESPWYRKHWGHSVQLAKDQNLKSFFQNTARGHMLATSIGGGSTGHGGDILCIDDPHNPKQALSPIQRVEAIEYITGTFITRLDDKEKGAVVAIMQRLHEEDATGYLLGESDDYTHLDIQGIAQERRVYSFPITKIKKTVEIGSILWPKRESRETMEKTRQEMGELHFAAQYLQSPTHQEGDIFKTDWWKYWDTLPDKIHEFLFSWDTAFKDKETSSFVVGQAWARSFANYYLMDQVRGHWNFPKTVKEFKSFTKKYPKIGLKLVEDKASGPMINDFLKDEISGIVTVNVPKLDKVARAQGVSYLIESGNVYLPADHKRFNWVPGFILECKNFPRGKFDDQVDTMSQALKRLKSSTYKNSLGNLGKIGFRPQSSLIKV